jgi:hypothetical protein
MKTPLPIHWLQHHVVLLVSCLASSPYSIFSSSNPAYTYILFIFQQPFKAIRLYYMCSLRVRLQSAFCQFPEEGFDYFPFPSELRDIE